MKKFKSITGKGAEGIVNGKDIKIVSPGLLARDKIPPTTPWRIPHETITNQFHARSVADRSAHYPGYLSGRALSGSDSGARTAKGDATWGSTSAEGPGTGVGL